MRHPRLGSLAAVTALGLAASAGLAGPFTAGNIVALRIGDGNAALSTAATPMFLVEMNPINGTIVQTIALPSTASGSTLAICTRGTSTSVGHLTRSLDRQYLTLMGVNLDAGLPSIQGTSSTTNARVIGRIDTQGLVDTSTALTDAYSTDDPRSAITTNGTDIWTSGTGSTATAGVRYTTFGSTTSTQLTNPPTNMRVVNIFNDQLYVSTMTGAFRGVNAVGSGVPTTSGQVATLLPGFDPSTTATESAYDFYFANANTLYVADDRSVAAGGGIQKWTFDGTTWTLAYTLNTGITVGCRGLTASPNKGGTTTLWATTGEATTTTSRVVMVLDTGATSAFTVVATSPPNTQYRGIDFSPEGAGPAPCYPDCNGDHALNVNDFICFQAAFAAASPQADCNHDTNLNVNDFICFQGAFAAGCSSL